MGRARFGLRRTAAVVALAIIGRLAFRLAIACVQALDRLVIA